MSTSVESNFQFFVQAVAGNLGKPGMSVEQFGYPIHGWRGSYRRLTAVWFIDRKNHGIGIDAFNGRHYEIRAWGHGEEVSNVEIMMRREPTFADLSMAAVLIGLLPATQKAE